MADLAQLATSGLLEDLANLRRYKPSIVASGGAANYQARINALLAELRKPDRKVAARLLDELACVPPDPVRPPCRLTPLADHVVILPTAAAEMTEGGLIIPNTAKERPVEGEVLAVGPGRTEPGIVTVVPAVTVGQTVLFGRYAGAEVTLDDERVLLMREEDILGILHPKAE